MRTNHILSTIAFAALAFVGCSQDDVLSESSSVNGAIEFGTYLGRDAQVTTRGSVVTTESIEDFGVYAYYTKNQNYADFDNTIAPNFMNNQQVTKGTDGNWVYTPVKYWPNNPDDKVSFFAYAPYNESAAPLVSTEAGKLYHPFTVAENAEDQIDLLWNRTAATDLSKQNIADRVNFTFAHALSRIGFSVEAAVDQIPADGTIADGTTIKIEKIILSADPYDNDDRYGTSTPATEPSTGAFYKSGKLLLNNAATSAEWDVTGTTMQSYTLTETDFVDNHTLSGSTKIEQLNEDDNYLMIIPQDFLTSGFYVNIQYTVTTEDTKLGGGNSTITNYISTQVKTKFESGKAYTYNLVLGMTSVKLSAVVDPWDETAEAIDVNLPANTLANTPAN